MMNPEPQSDDEYSDASAPDEQGSTFRGASMFAGSQNFVVAGGTFNNLTTNYAGLAPTDFRMLPLGDIDLQQDLSVESDSGIIGRRRERRCVRRVYSAKIGGRGSTVTVAVYQGDGGEKDWREDIERYMAVRHPNIVQVCGGASHGNVHATVFHGDLVPFKQYMARYSPIMTVYLYACRAIEWDRLAAYMGRPLRVGTLWIRCSTGRLCLDLVPPNPIVERFFWIGSSIPGTSSCPVNQDAGAIESLTIKQYHAICFHSIGLSLGTKITACQSQLP